MRSSHALDDLQGQGDELLALDLVPGDFRLWGSRHAEVTASFAGLRRWGWKARQNKLQGFGGLAASSAKSTRPEL